MIYYVALPFARVDGGLAPGEAVECPHEGAAIRTRSSNVPQYGQCRSVAFSRRGSPELGEFEDAVVLKTFGDVPDDFHFT